MIANWNSRDIQIEIINYITKSGGKSLLFELANRFNMDETSMMEIIRKLSLSEQVSFDDKYVWLKEDGGFKKKEFGSYFK